MDPVYRVSFFKRLTNPTGHEITACQGMVEVHATSETGAVEAACPLFARLAQVDHWSARADSATAEHLPGRAHAATARAAWWCGARAAR